MAAYSLPRMHALACLKPFMIVATSVIAVLCIFSVWHTVDQSSRVHVFVNKQAALAESTLNRADVPLLQPARIREGEFGLVSATAGDQQKSMSRIDMYNKSVSSSSTFDAAPDTAADASTLVAELEARLRVLDRGRVMKRHADVDSGSRRRAASAQARVSADTIHRILGSARALPEALIKAAPPRMYNTLDEKWKASLPGSDSHIAVHATDLIAARVRSHAYAQQQGAHVRAPLVIGVLSDPVMLWTLGLAAYATWVRDLRSYAEVLFFIGACGIDTSRFPGRVVCLNTSDTYPPQRKVHLFWEYMWRQKRTQFHWFLKLDHDTYVNALQLRRLTQQLLSPEHVWTPAYIGEPALGRAEEQSSLGLNGHAYCLGLGYMMNSLTLEAVGPHLMPECFRSTVSHHSDTEVGRCIFRHVHNTSCRSVEGFAFKQLYYQQTGSYVFPMYLQQSGQMQLAFPAQPKAAHFAATLLHPLKNATFIHRFHTQVHSNLRPPQPNIVKQAGQDFVIYARAKSDLRRTCVHNLMRQMQLHSFPLQECEAPKSTVSITVFSHMDPQTSFLYNSPY